MSPITTILLPEKTHSQKTVSKCWQMMLFSLNCLLIGTHVKVFHGVIIKEALICKGILGMAMHLYMYATCEVSTV